MFSKKDPKRNAFMLTGSFKKNGYDWWWHSFTGFEKETGEKKRFFAEFYIVNPGLGKDEVVFGDMDCFDKKPSYLMVKLGTWGRDHCELNRFFPINSITLRGKAPFSIACDDCYLDDTKLVASAKYSKEDIDAHREYMSDFGSIEMNLSIDKKIAYNVGYGASSFFRFIKAFEMYWHAEGMKSLFSGTVVYNGKTYIVSQDTSNGYADKNWGRNFTSPWIWLSTSELYSEKEQRVLKNSVFDIGGGKPKIYFLPLKRKLLGGLFLEGKEYEFNFSKFWTGSKTSFTCDVTENEIVWNVIQTTRKYKMETYVTSLKEEMIFVHYMSPDGKIRHRTLYNGGYGKGTIKLYERKERTEKLIDTLKLSDVGCEYGVYFDE